MNRKRNRPMDFAPMSWQDFDQLLLFVAAAVVLYVSAWRWF